MTYFEYKVVPAPRQRRRRQKRVDGLDRFASTISDILTELGLAGWDFIGAEVLRERRRRFLLLPDETERTFLVFRRPGSLQRAGDERSRAEAPPILEPVAPRRVKRPDLVAEVAAGARRIEVRKESPVNSTPSVVSEAAHEASGPDEPAKEAKVIAAE